MTLSIVGQPEPGKVDDRLGLIKGEIISLLEDKLEELRRESEKVRATMEQVLYRLGSQGFEVNLDDLRSGRWHKISSEVRALQDVVAILNSHQ